MSRFLMALLIVVVSLAALFAGTGIAYWLVHTFPEWVIGCISVIVVGWFFAETYMSLGEDSDDDPDGYA